MFPKEHGAYGQLLFPIATAFAVGHPSVSAVALAMAAACAFIAHEPLLVLMGQRGARAARHDRERAWRWFAGFGSAAMIASGIAIATLPRPAWAPLVLTGALAVGLAMFIVGGREHTVAGESWMSVTMGSFAAPLALAAGVPMQAAATIAVAFAAAFVGPTIAVHAVIAFTRRPPAVRSRAASLGATSLALAVVMVAASRRLIEPSGLWATVPACAAAAVLAVLPPSARRLRVVGWTLVATSSAAAFVLIVSLYRV